RAWDRALSAVRPLRREYGLLLPLGQPPHSSPGRRSVPLQRREERWDGGTDSFPGGLPVEAAEWLSPTRGLLGFRRAPANGPFDIERQELIEPAPRAIPGRQGGPDGGRHLRRIVRQPGRLRGGNRFGQIEVILPLLQHVGSGARHLRRGVARGEDIERQVVRDPLQAL